MGVGEAWSPWRITTASGMFSVLQLEQVDTGPAISIVDDGLVCPEVGSWAEAKHRLVSLYAKLFATGMKGKWGTRTYIELYAGAGYSRIREEIARLSACPHSCISVS